MAGNDQATGKMRRSARALRGLLGAALAATLLGGALPATAQPANQLTAVEVQTAGGQSLQVRLVTSAPAPQPITFTIDRPARLSVDLPDVGLALASRRIDVNSGGVDTIVAAEANGRTRLVVNLESLVAYTARPEGNAVIVPPG